MPSHAEVSATEPASPSWSPPGGWRAYERTSPLGHGDAAWERVSADVLVWGIKTRSGFHVKPGGRVVAGTDHELKARVGPLTINEPVHVVAVVDQADRSGFAYSTRPGHPVTGEEAFVVHRDAEGDIWLTLRSLTRAGGGRWRLAFPLILVAQRVYRWRYRRALVVR